jgi:hypothetical protein
VRNDMSIKRILMVAALGLGACGGQVGDGNTAEQGESLTSYTQRMISAYENHDGKGHYRRIALKDDATYLGLTSAGEERGSWVVTKPWIGPGHLTLTPTDPAGPPLQYETSLSWFTGRLTLTSGKVEACYQTLSSGYCGIDTDCNGQPFDRQSVSCGPDQHDGNLCTAAGTCTNACVDNGPPPTTPPPGGAPPPSGPHP